MIKNEDNSEHGTSGGNDTEDKVFLLSEKEAETLFSNDDERIAKATEYAEKSGVYVNEEKAAYWWLRSPGDDRYCAAVVNSDGWVYGDGSRVNGSDDGVRPALHLHLSSSNLFSYAGTVSSDGTKKEVPYNTRTRLVQN